jgi:Fe-S cluster assembly ATP-binding protein
MLLEVKDLHAGIDGKEILKGLNLQVNKGEVHAIMGPNGSGKSTLSKVLAGHPSYEVMSGEVFYEGKNLFDLEPDERARQGVFMAFQYPVEVPGVSNAQFLRLAYNEKMKHLGQEELDPLEFNDHLKEKAKIVDMDPVAEGVNKLRSSENAIILVTHYQRLLNFIVPDAVHVLAGGRIVKEGGKELALELEEKGYDWVKAANQAL